MITKARAARLVAVAGAAGLTAALASCSGPSTGRPVPTTGTSGAAARTAGSASPLPSSATSDGGVTMSIAGVDCGRRSPDGTYCHVTVRLVNISDGFPVFTEDDQIAFDTAGHAIAPDRAATASANGGRAVTQRLQRGVPVTVTLVYDVPRGSRLDRVVLHGQAGTPGQEFPLR